MDESMQNLAQKLASLADELRNCAVRGSRFASNIYDRENYQKVQEVALELFALASGQLPASIEPLRLTLFANPGPFLTGDGAIIDDAGRILLIRRSDNGLWAMPGGGLEVGETAAQGVVREVLEETGITCEPVALVGIYDSRLCGTSSLYHMYHVSFLCRPLTHIAVIDPPIHANEVMAKGWFTEDALPEELDSGHIHRIPDAFRVWRGDHKAFFEKVEL